MKEIRAVKFKLSAVMPGVSKDVSKELDDVFWRYSDVHGIPSAVVFCMDLCDRALTGIMDNNNESSDSV